MKVGDYWIQALKAVPLLHRRRTDTSKGHLLGACFSCTSEEISRAMDHARKAIYNMFGAQPLSYTRFSLGRQSDGDSSHVEMKLSAEEEEGVENGTIDHLHTRKVKPRNSRHLGYLCAGTALLFLIGFLLGYVSFRARMQSGAKCNNGADLSADGVSLSSSPENTETNNVFVPLNPEPVLYWGDLKKKLSEKLISASFRDLLGRISSTSHEAGSTGDEILADDIHEKFVKYQLDKVWNDEHYVRLQVQGSVPNVVSLEDPEDNLETPSAYVAYSESAEVSGQPVYANYGRKDDFRLLVKRTNISGAVILLRAGSVTIAEKVANAKMWGAVGVLIYPDPADYMDLGASVSLFGHAHLGTGDPYTPGFPSFNHTLFPPVQSSALPRIPVQTISSSAAQRLFSAMSGTDCPSEWKGTLQVIYKCAASPVTGRKVRLRVNNLLVEKKILNIFGVIKGVVEPDRYIMLGAQRDAWGSGVVKAGVGTAVLLELARILSEMVKTDGYKPRRSIVFASWSAGEFGAVGATEWLEGYAASLHMKAFAYVNLDSVVSGSQDFRFSSSPMLKKVLQEAVADIKLLSQSLQVLVNKEVPFRLDDASRTFTTSSGIPAISFSFNNGGQNYPYPYLGTTEDHLEKLYSSFGNNPGQLENTIRAAAEIAGRMAIRLTHDHTLNLDYKSYDSFLHKFVMKLTSSQRDMRRKGMDLQWLFVARGDFTRATAALGRDIQTTDLNNRDACRLLNDRLMKVEYLMLSPYVSPKDVPFRHIFLGSGSHTIQALLDHADLLKTNADTFNETQFRNQLALLTWTIQGAANALSGDIWDINNEI